MNYIYKKIDIEMALSSLIFLIPGIIHYYENEKLEAIFWPLQSRDLTQEGCAQLQKIYPK